MSYKVSIAPMMECTDRHYRYLMGLITKHTRLYSEMVVAKALRFREPEYFLAHKKPTDNPVALQLGGSDPTDLVHASELGQQFGYDEINLNVGCPSDRVQAGKIGACLMAEPALVARCLKEMQTAVDVPVTIKHRLGLDQQDSYDAFKQFVATIADNSACTTFIIHARNAILKGLNPKENRTIPPLKYNWVTKLKEDFPHLQIILNGGIKTLNEIEDHLQKVDGVMLGRAAYDNPFLFSEVDTKLFSEQSENYSRVEIAKQWLPYLRDQVEQGIPLHRMTRHLVGLFKGQPKGKLWRKALTTTKQSLAELEELIEQMSFMSPTTLQSQQQNAQNPF